MNSTDAAIYPGATISKKTDPRREIQFRITTTMPIPKTLDIIWNQTGCNAKWKIPVHNAVINSKVLYRLGTIEGTERATQMLDPER